MRLNTSNARQDLSSAGGRIEGRVHRVLAEAAVHAKGLAQSSNKFQDKTGRLRATIRVAGSGMRTRIVSALKYSQAINDGSPKHIIFAKDNSKTGLLKFKIAGRWISKQFVMHPGTKPRPFMDDAADTMEVLLPEWMDKALGSLL